jgi:hypothetical protein
MIWITGKSSQRERMGVLDTTRGGKEPIADCEVAEANASPKEAPTSISRANAESLSHGTVLYHRRLRNGDRSPLRCRVTGACKTWVTRPEDFKIPVKYGLRDSFYIEPHNASEWCLDEDEASKKESLPEIPPA